MHRGWILLTLARCRGIAAIFSEAGAVWRRGKERADELVFCARFGGKPRNGETPESWRAKWPLEDVSGVRQKVDKPGHKYPLDTAFALVGIEKYVSVARISC